MERMEFVVLTCDKYLSSRVETIKKTWGYGKNIKFLSDSTSDSSDVIGYNTPQNYDGIFLKFLNFFKHYDFKKSDYFFFSDDDTFINLKNLDLLDLPSSEEPFAICRLLCLNPDGTDIWGNQTGTDVSKIYGENTHLPLYYPSGGSGFILSQSACNSIQNYLSNSKDLPKNPFGDITLGFWMRNSNINLIPNKNFWWSTHENLMTNTWEKYESDEEVITFHYVNESQMNEYHKKYNIS